MFVTYKAAKTLAIILTQLVGNIPYHIKKWGLRKQDQIYLEVPRAEITVIRRVSIVHQQPSTRYYPGIVKR